MHGGSACHGVPVVVPDFAFVPKCLRVSLLVAIEKVSHADVIVCDFGIRASWQVAIDSIDADLFGRGVRGGFFQPSDAMLHRIRTTMYDILREAYAEDMVRRLPLNRTQRLTILPSASRCSQKHNNICASLRQGPGVWLLNLSILGGRVRMH